MASKEARTRVALTVLTRAGSGAGALVSTGWSTLRRIERPNVDHPGRFGVPPLTPPGSARRSDPHLLDAIGPRGDPARTAEQSAEPPEADTPAR